jgi:deazaflavin-dependent oxidoreductase (nitroreductase family)
MTWYLEVADRTWPVLRRLMAGHATIYRATRGVVGHRIPGIGSMLLLEHVGAKSGTKRTSPLLYGRDGDGYVLVASKGGNPKNPAWYHNLKANPDTEIQVGSSTIPVHARVTEGEERDRLFRMMEGVYSGYTDYKKRTSRTIPVIVLEPR